ncbi:MAG: DHHA1 domain-containing protein [Thermoplasmatota archaeon]
MDALLQGSVELAGRIRRASSVKIVSHIDADGLSSAAVATAALDRLGIPYSVEFLKSLTPQHAERLLNENPELLWFTDLGSGAADRIVPQRPNETVISDHHVPSARGPYHLNCHFAGEDGARYLCGATTTFLVARALDAGNADLAGIALVGSVGDLQDTDEGRLVGMNRYVLEQATAAGALRAMTDIRAFGRETRTLSRLLQYADDPPIPGAAGRADACESLLTQVHVPFLENDTPRHWAHLSREERQRILSAVGKRLLNNGYGAKSVRRLIGEVYTFPHEEPGTPVRDAKEFATLLNSTARYGEAEIGLAVARGDRGEAYARALDLLQGHRQNLVAGITYVLDNGIGEREYLQWFHARDAVRETIVGIVAGMLYGRPGVRRDLPIFGFAHAEGNQIKVSGRGTRALVEGGLNLSEVCREAAAAVGGAGGGHAPAAGATIPAGREPEFLDAAETIIARQMHRA